jgi:hypothetical protein
MSTFRNGGHQGGASGSVEANQNNILDNRDKGAPSAGETGLSSIPAPVFGATTYSLSRLTGCVVVPT